MKALPLFYYPSTWVWVDDDSVLLNTMSKVFSAHNNIVSFSSAEECLSYFRNYQPITNQYSFLAINQEDENYGATQQSAMSFDLSLIIELANNPKRHNEISVMVIDYNMPEESGFSLAQKIDTCIPKILLTGNTEEQKAIEGFNNNLINRFVHKSESEMIRKLDMYLNTLTKDYFQKLTKPLLTCLETEKKSPLSDPIFIEFFERHCKENNIQEYYLIDREGSFLCVDDKGNHSCLVVHTDSSLENWIELYEEDARLIASEIDAVKQRNKIPFFGIDQEAWQVESPTWPNYLYDARLVNGRSRYFCATVCKNLFKVKK